MSVEFRLKDVSCVDIDLLLRDIKDPKRRRTLISTCVAAFSADQQAMINMQLSDALDKYLQPWRLSQPYVTFVNGTHTV